MLLFLKTIIARLSLLFYSLTYGNKWNTHAGDLLRISKSNIKIPYVRLGNPPYEEIRGNSKKIQKAAFLDIYLNWLHDGVICHRELGKKAGQRNLTPVPPIQKSKKPI